MCKRIGRAVRAEPEPGARSCDDPLVALRVGPGSGLGRGPSLGLAMTMGRPDTERAIVLYEAAGTDWT